MFRAVLTSWGALIDLRTRLALASLLACLGGCPPLPPEVVTCEEADACGTSGSTAHGDDETPTTSGSVHTVTGDDDAGSTTPDPETTAETLDTTGEPADEPPSIINGVVIPDYIDDNGVLTVEASTINSEGVHLLLDTGEQIELTPGRPGEFVGEIPAFTGLHNGKRFAWLTPWYGATLGETVEVDYVIALPSPGHEIAWQADGMLGSVIAIDLLPDGSPVELGTFQEMGESRCYLRRRDKNGNLVDFVPLLSPAYCRAIDLKIDRETGVMHVLVEREQGDGTVWWAGEISSWGKGPKNIGIGALGDTAHALAARPDVVAVCGSRDVATGDKLDGLAVLLRPGELPDERTFDYQPLKDPKPHKFTETVRDCAMVDDKLVLVGETRGPHEAAKDDRDRLTLIEAPLAISTKPVWTVAGLDQGVQTRALALDLDAEGLYHLAGYSCEDVCDPVGEVRVHASGGALLDRSSLGPLGSLWFGPHDIAWSPAGYAVVALGEQQGQLSVFKVQAFAPGDPVPLWTFLPNDKQGTQLALAVAVGPAGEVYAGGVGDGHPAFARIGG